MYARVYACVVIGLQITEYYCGNATGFTKYISSQEDDGSSYTELTFHSDDSVEDKGFNITISYQQRKY